MKTDRSARRWLIRFWLLAFLGASGPGALVLGQSVTVSVDPQADRKPISPFIYGVSLAGESAQQRMRYPVNRWGGNSTTRFNWKNNVSNRASDWFFMNVHEGDGFIDGLIGHTLDNGGEMLLTVPLIGWTPIGSDTRTRWGFSIAKYGAQEQNECDWLGPGYHCDAGNGMKPDGVTPVTGNDPRDTSEAINTGFVSDWIAHLIAGRGTASGGGVRFYDLDNEPMLWNSTHRDVHPQPTTAGEIWQKTLDYALAIKTADPQAQTLGPAVWGWCAYFYTARDGCGQGDDWAGVQGNIPFLAWYLKQVRNYETAHGLRLVDYLDVHYYPQGDGVYDDSVTTAAQELRLRSLKSLYDPAYVDESWIGEYTGEAVRLIPRMKEWIDAYAPGTKLAINEYAWSQPEIDDHPSAAVAQAEVLAILGREGVDMACRWTCPREDTLTEDAFRLYLNYDGLGSAITGESVRAVSSSLDKVGAYAVRSVADRLYVLLFNKSLSAEQSVSVSISGVTAATATLYQLYGGHRLGPAGSQAVTGGRLPLTLPALSATLAVLDIGGPPGLRLIAPNGGEYWTRGAVKPVTWESNAAGTVRLILFRNRQKLGEITRSVAAGAGRFSWTVGQYGSLVAPAGSGYQIRLRSADGTLEDYSDLFFTIQAPSRLALTSPNGGESWSIGSNRSITWNTGGFTGSVKLVLFRDGRKIGGIASLPAAAGKFAWTAGAYIGGTAAAGGGCAIRLVAADGSTEDYSDAPFTLTQ